MSKIDMQSVEYYQELMARDPNSQAFAALAEAYRQMNRLPDAEKVARNGIQRHPHLATGYLVLGKILRDQKKFDESLKALKSACQMNPENLLAHQLVGELYLEKKMAKEALKAFKTVLFLNPLSEKAKRVVKKLESVTADEFEDDVFEMTKLKKASSQINKNLDSDSQPTESSSEVLNLKSKNSSPSKASASRNLNNKIIPKGLERMLSLIDAFIIRNDLMKAKSLLYESQNEFGDHPDIQQRIRIIENKSNISGLAQTEEAQELSPIESRENRIRQKKLDTLYSLLQKIENFDRT